LPLFIGGVVFLSFLLLMSVFRSLAVAVKAAVMNLLSIGAAYGIMALAAGGGRFGGLVGIEEATPVPAWLPMTMFAVLFGLSMDYEVFLLSRVREEYVRTRDNRRAVADGLAATARVITAAAAIMVTVFGAFVLEDAVFLKLAGLGLATAVLVDATVVRMVLVPATMELLGDRNWWLPRWLDRLLPSLDVEGEAAVAEPAPALAVDGGSTAGGAPEERDVVPV
ncbi:MAG TPA: MMPL family transporter, partial [Acidimicrobiales bacterium]